MSAREHRFTSESVSEGHPDKMADRVSDAVLDWLLERDSEARVACETLVANDLIVVAGEFGSRRIPDLLPVLEREIPGIARGVAREIGYRGGDTGFDPEGCEVRLSIGAQSRDIDRG